MMLVFTLLPLLTLALAAVPDDHRYELVWSDEFNEFDPSKWEKEITANGGGNNEFQVYLPDEDNSWVQDGMMHLKATLLKDNINPATGEPYGDEFLQSGVMNLWDLYGHCSADWNYGCYREGQQIPPIASARLRTADRFAYRFGRVEIRARMPVGDWLWPAIWMLPERDTYGQWPRSGEIDISEVIGNEDLKGCWDSGWDTPWGIRRTHQGMHWGLDAGQNKHMMTGVDIIRDVDFGRNFHIWTLDWSPQGLEYYVDGEQILHVPHPPILDRDSSDCYRGFHAYGAPWDNDVGNIWQDGDWPLVAPFDTEFHFLLNIAVGGEGFIPDSCINREGEGWQQKPWTDGEGQMQGMQKFYSARDNWLWTWEKEEEVGHDTMQVDYIRVYQREADNGPTQEPPGC